ncbi:MAG TPA: fibronectin type III domain-containing protein [Vicinamibacterales bacterium]|nr:fibronectin type III domain-containing protein [Vicinamibacterales bacterium]
MKRRTYTTLSVCALAASVYACSSANPATPVAPSTQGPAAAADGSTLKVTAPSVVSPTNDVKVTSGVIDLTASPSTFQFASASPVALQYRFQIFNADGTMVENAVASDTTYRVSGALTPNMRHTWKVRAESQGQVGPFSTVGSFVTEDPALINDPLTDGTTKGARIGGHFVAGQGWQSDSLTDAIDYDIGGGCVDCRFEFDATNFGGQEGFPFAKDLKWVSMGDPGAFGSFGAFRDHPWKMHLVQRADYSSGMEIIWRNGGVGDGREPGDHRIKLTSTPLTFRSSEVYHFQLDWGLFGYTIKVNGIEIFSDGWDHWYELAPLRIELGCIPRGESFVGIVYRNVKLIKH